MVCATASVHHLSGPSVYAAGARGDAHKESRPRAWAVRPAAASGRTVLLALERSAFVCSAVRSTGHCIVQRLGGAAVGSIGFMSGSTAMQTPSPVSRRWGTESSVRATAVRNGQQIPVLQGLAVSRQPRPNTSIERTFNSRLRRLLNAAHVKRYAFKKTT